MKTTARDMNIRNSRFQIWNQIAVPHSPFANQGVDTPRSPESACGARRGFPRRAGFTLVELMVVIVIIGILAALVLPAIYRAVVAAREARVIVEINGLSTAIATFKSKYGAEPPSKITIYTTQAGWNSDPAAMATIRGLWPQFDFSMTMPDPANPGNTRGAYPNYWTGNQSMNSGECLLFFLGGVMGDNASGPNQVPTGFAKNPRYPFAPSNVVGNREGPFFEFSDISRVRDVDGNGINEWYDSLPGQTNPYLYFSSYDGQGYRLTELPQNGGSFLFIHDFYRVAKTTYSPPATPSSTIPGTSADSTLTTAQKPQSFQIISPGYDTNYGSGGVFSPNLPNSGLTDSNGNPDTAAYDNLTNFNNGRLKP